MEILRKNKNRNVTKNAMTEIKKNSLMGTFIEWTQLRKNISKLEDMTMDPSKTEKQK